MILEFSFDTMSYHCDLEINAKGKGLVYAVAHLSYESTSSLHQLNEDAVGISGADDTASIRCTDRLRHERHALLLQFRDGMGQC